MHSQIESWDPVYTRLGRVLFAAYAHHSGGKDHKGLDLPNWSTIVEREHDVAETYEDRRDDIRPEGVASHWRYCAWQVAATPALAEQMAAAIEARHATSEVFMRMAQ